MMSLTARGWWCYRLMFCGFIFPWRSSAAGSCVDRGRMMMSWAVPIHLVINIVFIILCGCHLYLKRVKYITPLTSTAPEMLTFTATKEYLMRSRSLPVGCWLLRFLQSGVGKLQNLLPYNLHFLQAKQTLCFGLTRDNSVPTMDEILWF